MRTHLELIGHRCYSNVICVARRKEVSNSDKTGRILFFFLTPNESSLTLAFCCFKLFPHLLRSLSSSFTRHQKRRTLPMICWRRSPFPDRCLDFGGINMFLYETEAQPTTVKNIIEQIIPCKESVAC